MSIRSRSRLLEPRRRRRERMKKTRVKTRTGRNYWWIRKGRVEGKGRSKKGKKIKKRRNAKKKKVEGKRDEKKGNKEENNKRKTKVMKSHVEQEKKLVWSCYQDEQQQRESCTRWTKVTVELSQSTDRNMNTSAYVPLTDTRVRAQLWTGKHYYKTQAVVTILPSRLTSELRVTGHH